MKNIVLFGKPGAGKKCKNFSQCGQIGTHDRRAYCKQCWNAKRVSNESATSACTRCLLSKNSPEYVAVPCSNVCVTCYNGGHHKCKAWIADGELCSNLGHVKSIRDGKTYREPVCTLHMYRDKCGKVKGKNRKDTKYVVQDGNGSINEDWVRRIE